MQSIIKNKKRVANNWIYTVLLHAVLLVYNFFKKSQDFVINLTLVYKLYIILKLQIGITVLLKLKSACVKLVVLTFLFKQVIVCTSFNNSAVVKYNDNV